jgi:Transcriptional regulator, AbiEi antitoxin
VDRAAPITQRARALAFLKAKGMARLSEIVEGGIAASTISRMEREGAVVRLARGLYQLPDASIDAHHTLAEAAKLVPKGVICLTSALAFHELTDQVPAKVWIAIGPKDWRPKFLHPPVRFGEDNRRPVPISEHRWHQRRARRSARSAPHKRGDPRTDCKTRG